MIRLGNKTIFAVSITSTNRIIFLRTLKTCNMGHEKTKRTNDFDKLVINVEQVHSITSSHAQNAINQLLTVRNWAIGYYIVEFEQNGQNRATYGEKLLSNLASRLKIKGLDRSMLNICRKFYITYPQICDSVNHKLQSIGNSFPLQSLSFSQAIKTPDNFTKSNKFQTSPEQLIGKLSFTHLREIMTIDDSFERYFYEFECIRCNWSVRELKRQIATNLFFRAGISKNPQLLLKDLKRKKNNTSLSIKDSYTFEFLGLEAKQAVNESELEQALMNHLQEFLLEMGRGFCFEAKQKRIMIDDEYYYVDLVLYNRILHCNVIIELKNDKFCHEHLGQLNTYISYYKENEMTEGDNPPIGILLCTQKGKKMVEYALAGMDNNLFVSTYMLTLPNTEILEKFLLQEIVEQENS